MLDTNAVSSLIKAHPQMARRVVAASMASLCISAVTGDELLFALAKRLDARKLHLAVGEFLRRVDVLPWDAAVATRYGTILADLQRQGKRLAPLDMLIATHALCVGAVLVTNDRAFSQVSDLDIEDWTV